MKIDIEKIVNNRELARVAAQHLAYALQNVKDYKNLTPKQREIISPVDFDRIMYKNS